MPMPNSLNNSPNTLRTATNAPVKLIIADKTSSARSIVAALEHKEAFTHHTGYFRSENYIVTWAPGHLYRFVGFRKPIRQALTLDDIYNLEMTDGLAPDIFFFVPYDKSDKIKTQHLEIINSLIFSGEVGEIIHAGDINSNGEICIRILLHQAKCSKPVWRLWSISATKESIRRSFNCMKPLFEYNHLARVGYCNMYRNHIAGNSNPKFGLESRSK